MLMHPKKQTKYEGKSRMGAGREPRVATSGLQSKICIIIKLRLFFFTCINYFFQSGLYVHFSDNIDNVFVYLFYLDIYFPDSQEATEALLLIQLPRPASGGAMSR